MSLNITVLRILSYTFLIKSKKMIIIFIIGLIISISGAIRDGISDRYLNVGWTWWHIIGWLSRDVPVFLCILLLLILNASPWMFITIIISRLLHKPIYDYVRSNWIWFKGSPDPPYWFLIFRRLWSWLIK